MSTFGTQSDLDALFGGSVGEPLMFPMDSGLNPYSPDPAVKEAYWREVDKNERQFQEALKENPLYETERGVLHWDEMTVGEKTSWYFDENPTGRAITFGAMDLADGAGDVLKSIGSVVKNTTGLLADVPEMLRKLVGAVPWLLAGGAVFAGMYVWRNGFSKKVRA